MTDVQTTTSETLASSRIARFGLAAFGLINVCLGVIGAVVPVMPSTIFFLIALWAFSKSSKRLHDWLFYHRLFGRLLRDWHQHRVIPLKIKIFAVTVMALVLAYITVAIADGPALPVALAIVLSGVTGYILSRPSAVEQSDTA